jgi:ribose 1,5-bisphosphokinase PhnN
MYGNLSKLSGKTKVVILIGESGAGKSTLSEFLDMPDNWFISSNLMIDIINKKGLPVNHDTIHEVANEKYKENLYWQIPFMVQVVERIGLLLLDGPRRTDEVKKIRELYPESVIIKVVSGPQERQRRLSKRDGADKEAFKRIVADEKSQTGLINQLMAMADITVENNGSLEDLQNTAKEIHERLKGGKIHEYESRSKPL